MSRQGESRAAAQRRVKVARATVEALEEEFAKKRRAELMDPDKTKMSYAVARMMAEDEVAESDPADAIVGFGDGFLSPGYQCSVSSEGVEYPTLEHAFQSRKSISTQRREAIKACATCIEAKRLGSQALKSDDATPHFRESSIAIMDELLRDKFFRHKDLWAKLKASRGKRLIHYNTFDDAFWGEVQCGDTMRRGRNELGKALDRVRRLSDDDLLKAWLKDRAAPDVNEQWGFQFTYRRSGSSETTQLDVIEQTIVLCGRGSADVVLEHASSSRLHAAIYVDKATRMAAIVDLGSAHGTFTRSASTDDFDKLEPLVPRPLDSREEVRFALSSRRYRARLLHNARDRGRAQLYSKLAAVAREPLNKATAKALRVDNLAYDASTRDLRDAFPEAIHFKILKGKALVAFETERAATMALASDRDKIKGRAIRCSRAADADFELFNFPPELLETRAPHQQQPGTDQRTAASSRTRTEVHGGYPSGTDGGVEAPTEKRARVSFQERA